MSVCTVATFSSNSACQKELTQKTKKKLSICKLEAQVQQKTHYLFKYFQLIDINRCKLREIGWLFYKKKTRPMRKKIASRHCINNNFSYMLRKPLNPYPTHTQRHDSPM
jgi:hypothetical protein